MRHLPGVPIIPIFLLAIEPLVVANCVEQDVEGIPMVMEEVKALLYMDHILLLLSHSQTSLAAVMSTIEDFSFLLGYKVK